MPNARSNIILVGMPGAGKSTVGIILAKMTARSFVDTDVLIQTEQKRSLQSIVDTDGYMALRRVEEDTLLRLDVHNHVIATGGSAVYSSPAMQHLGHTGKIVFLKVSLAALLARVKDFDTRGLAKRPDQSFEELFTERCRLYEACADISVVCDTLNQEEVCHAIVAAFTAEPSQR